ncbi:hypothetical protein VTO73DRAFT_12865 [Trametes versicolor]
MRKRPPIALDPAPAAMPESATPRTPNPFNDDQRMREASPRGNNEGQTQANKRPRTDFGTVAVVSTAPASPERLALRKVPNRQDLWEREAQEAPPCPPMPTIPSGWNPWNSPYDPKLDPAVFAGMPTGRGANPHFKMSRVGATPPLPLLPHRPFPEGPFEIAPIPAADFRGNLSPQQLEELDRMRTTETILALIPHGAGKAVNLNASTIMKDAESFIGSLAFEENDRMAYRVTVHPPDMRNRAGGWNANPFGKPWVFFLQLPKDASPLRDFLLWQRVFAVSKTVSFTIYDLDEDVQCWDHHAITGMWIRNGMSHGETLDQKVMLLTAIKHDICASDKFRVFAAKMAYTNLKHTGDLEEVLNTLTNTFHLERTEAVDDSGSMIPAYVLLARPPTASKEEYMEWCSYFTYDSVNNCAREAYRTSMQRFDVAFLPVRVWCELCKSRIHCTARCPWPSTEGWLGTTAADLGVRTAPGSNPPSLTGPAGVVLTPLILSFRQASAAITPAQAGPAGPAGTTRGRGRGNNPGRARGRGTGRGACGARGGRGGRGGP